MFCSYLAQFPQMSSQYFRTIWNKFELRYSFHVSRVRAYSALQQPSHRQGHGANLRKKGYGRRGKTHLSLLPNSTFEGISPSGGTMSSHDSFAASGNSPTRSDGPDFRCENHGSLFLLFPLTSTPDFHLCSDVPHP